MTMADVLAVTLVILGLLVTLPALWLFLRALFPGAVARGRARLETSPGVCFLAGLLPWALFFLAGLALLSKGAPPLKFLGFLMVAAGIVVEGIGLAALSTLVGDRLPSTADEGKPWRGLVRGAVCMELAFLLPFVGWFGIMPLASVAAVGAALLGSSSRGEGSPAGAAPATPAA
jgi:hypothetical protein